MKNRSCLFWILSLSGILLIISCSTYYDRVTKMHSSITSGNLEQAKKEVEKSKFLNRKRNRMLYCLEMGKLTHLMQEYDSSNKYLNEADHLMEEFNNALDHLKGSLINPAIKTYRAEDIERVLVNYYKALNYLYLGKKENALVEARKINLKLKELSDKNNGKNKYSTDAFSLLLMGLIYESDRDYNNAFISYRNAYEAYKKDSLLVVFGTPMPTQLKQDLLRSAYLSGFTDEVSYYERLFGIKYNHVPAGNGDLIMFWENGLGPYKEQHDIYFSLSEKSGGYYFSDNASSIVIPFSPPSSLDSSERKKVLSSLGIIHIAFPKYVQRPNYYTKCKILVDSVNTFMSEEVENINHIAVKTLQDRFLKEVAYALERLVIRKISEYYLKQKNQTSGEILELANLIAEKADTRNWQTLPASISYSRIPLQKGKNEFKLVFMNNTNTISDTVTITAEGNKRMLFKNVSTPKQILSLTDKRIENVIITNKK